MSVLAAVTARMMELGLEMYFRIRSRIWSSMSLGWSPTGTCGSSVRLGQTAARTHYVDLLSDDGLVLFAPLLIQEDRPESGSRHEERRL